MVDATAVAQAALLEHDRQLAIEDAEGAEVADYPERVIELASARFDTWARRGVSAVDSADAVADYARWLSAYVDNWVGYARETCPRLTIARTLRERLSQRATSWLADAVAAQSPDLRR